MRGGSLILGMAALAACGAAVAPAAVEGNPPSCASVGGQTRYVVKTELVQLPAVGADSRAEVGQSMISAASRLVYGRQIALETPLQVDGVPAAYAKRGKSEQPGKYLFAFKVQPGWYPYDGAFPSSDGGPLSVWDVPGLLPVSAAGRPYERGRVGLEAVDKDHLRVVWTIDRAHWKSPPLQARYREATCTALAQNSLRRELIYGGVTGRTISISYREFADNTARPAFTQELKYDLTDGREIGFQGARFEVIEATNTQIRFRVIKPLG